MTHHSDREEAPERQTFGCLPVLGFIVAAWAVIIVAVVEVGRWFSWW